MMVDAPVASVIVPARDAARTLGEVLDALGRQTVPRDTFEVIVVDNRSTDATSEVAAAHGADQVLREETPGAAAARNRGIQAARGPVLAFLDADCLPDPGWLQAGLARLDETGAGLVGGRVDTRPGPGPAWLAYYDRLSYVRQAERIAQSGLSATACLFVRRDVIDRIGPFRPELRAAEDDEFCLRAAASGFTVAYAEGAAVSREAATGAGAVVRRYHRAGRAEAALARAGVHRPPSPEGGFLARRLAYARRVWADPDCGFADRLRILLLNATGAVAQVLGRLRGPERFTGA
jgi:glycosyltransferase involved in cell wall biosynthesis